MDFVPSNFELEVLLEARHLALLIDAHLAHHSVAGARAIAACPRFDGLRIRNGLSSIASGWNYGKG